MDHGDLDRAQLSRDRETRGASYDGADSLAAASMVAALIQRIYNTDARTIDPGSIDVLITDPPYSEHVHASAVSQSATRGARKRDLGFESLGTDLRDYIARCSALARRWSVIYSDVESIHEWRNACQAAGARYVRTIPWVRWSMPQLSGDRPPTGCEMLSVFYGAEKGAMRWGGPGNLTHFAHTCLRGEGKHKTEKPLDQALDLVEFFSEPGETVYDPCAGAGTIGVACALLGRVFAGCELQIAWAEHAQKRIDAARAGVLDARDSERFERWLKSFEALQQDKARLKEINDKARAKAAARKVG